MLRFIDGGGLAYDTNTLLYRWTATGSTTWSTVNTGTVGRWGGRCLEVTLAASIHGGYGKGVPLLDTYVVQVAFQVVSHNSGVAWLPLVMFTEGGSPHTWIGFNLGNMRLLAARGSLNTPTQVGSYSVPSIALGQWNYLQVKLKVHDSAGTVDVLLNGTSALALSGVDTRNGGSGVIDTVWFGSNIAFGGGTVSVVRFQDIAICDTTGPAPLNDIHPEGRMRLLSPTANGAINNGTPSAGSAWQCVDEVPANGNTDYVALAVSGDTELYALSDLPTTPTTIYGVLGANVLNKDDAGPANVAPIVYTNGIVYSGSEASVASTTYAPVTHIWELNPDTGLAWTPTEINTLQGGLKRVS